MNSKKEMLLKKYWEGKTSLEEEKELKQFHLSSSKPENIPDDYFGYLRKKRIENPLGEAFEGEILDLISERKNKKKPKSIAIKYWYVAASLALIISSSIIFKNEIFNTGSEVKTVEADTFNDPELAFEETKKALLMLSTKLNQSSEYAVEFSKFEQSQNQLKQN